jgi:adenylate cyclase
VIFTQKARETDGKLPGSLTAYDCMIRFYQYWRTFDRVSYPSVRSCLEKAIVADPYHAEAFAALSLTYSDGYRFGFDSSASAGDLLRKAINLARHSIELEPGCTRGYHALLVAYWLSNDVERGFEAARAGLAINQNDTALKADLGTYYVLRNNRESGLRLLREAYAQNPSYPSGNRLALAVDHYLSGHYREALTEATQIDMPFLVYGYAAEAMAAAQLGLDQQAAAAVEKILAIDPGFGEHFVEHLESRNVHPEMIPILADGLRMAGLHIPEGPHRDEK